MIVTPPREDEATGHVAEMYAADRERDAFVYAHTRAMAINPEAHAAFESLVRALIPALGVRRYELVTLAAAAALGSSHCLLAHGRKSVDAGIVGQTQLQRIARGDDADLPSAERAMMAYARKLSTDASAMTEADSQALRDEGFTDREIVDITLAAAARNYFSRSLQALAVPLEDVPGLDADTAAALRER